MKASFISGVVKYVSATIAALLLIAFLRTIPDFRSVFQLHFRSYALLSLLTIVSNCYLLFLMKQRKNREPETFWFALLLVSLTVWAVAEFFQRLSITPEGAIFWESFTLVGWVILPVTFFMFATTYTSNTQILDDFTLVPILIFAALFFLYAAARTDLIAIHNPALAIYRPWGYVTLNGPYFSIIIAWLETLFIMGLILLAQHYRQSHHQIKKRQTRLFIIGVLIPLVGGTITEAILPILGISTLPSSVLLTSIMAGILTYGIFRYGLFSFNPITIAPSILQTMNEAVLGVNAEFKIEFVNKGAMNMLGYAENDLLGMPLQQYISAVDPNNQIEQQLLQSTPIDSPIQKHEGTVLTASRKKIPIAISTTKIMGEHNEVAGYISVLEDLTEIKKSYNALAQINAHIEQEVKNRTNELAEAQARLMASINSLNVGYIITNHLPAIVLSNQSAMTLLAKANIIDSDSLSHSLDRSFNLEELAQRLGKEVNFMSKIQACLSHKKIVRLDTFMSNKIFLDLTISPIIMKRKTIGAVILIQDVTEERMVERAKDELFSIASHELRTPLTVIRGYSSVIEKHYASLLADIKLKTMVRGIHSSSVRLINIVNEFLDTSRLEQKRMSFTLSSFNLVETVDEVINEYTAFAQGHKLSLTNQTPHNDLPLAYGDRERVKEVLINLISNAIKYTHKGGISVMVSAETNQLQVRVSDTGKGIAPENQSLLFRKFQQAGQNTISRDASHGTGLGLYISKLIVETMGGKIWLEDSELGKGSTFIFTLPSKLPNELKK